MRKLLSLLPAALIPLLVYTCGFHNTADVAKEVVQEQIDEHAADLKERFDALPRSIPLTKPEAPDYSAPAPKRRVPVAKPHVTKRPAVKAPVPLPPPQIEEKPLPPQQGVICIFPLNMIPHCAPEPAGRMP